MPITSVRDGLLDVATPGTAVRFPAVSGARASRVHITARSTNTNVVTVGASTVVGAAATRRGVGVPAGATVSLIIDALDDLYLDAITIGEGVSYLVEVAD